MINLMYVVLMAMLALNVSTEVLNGFSLVEESLSRTTANAAKENQVIYDDFAAQLKANPAKVKAWFDKAQAVKRMSDSLYSLAAELKQAIVREADGEDGDVKNIVGKEDLEAANQVMLAPGRGRGRELYDAINSFRERILSMVTDPTQQAIIRSNLSTDVPRNIQTMGKNWQEYMFEDMPVAAAVTLLSKLQSDVRYAEGEVLHTLVSNIDLKDIRVNSLNAFVIPNSQTIVRGDKFSAHIVMAAVDTTQVPEIYIGNRKMDLKDGLYETVCSRTGDFTLAGYIEMLNGNGERVRRDFSQKYTVVDPSATVSADLMNMLYAGYSNPISVSVPGVPLNKVTATMTGGTLQPVGPGKYIARPAAIGKDVTITVSSTNTGRVQQMGQFTFRVRKLPDGLHSHGRRARQPHALQGRQPAQSQSHGSRRHRRGHRRRHTRHRLPRAQLRDGVLRQHGQRRADGERRRQVLRQAEGYVPQAGAQPPLLHIARHGRWPRRA